MSSTTTLDAAAQAVDQKNFEAAVQQLTEALDGGGLMGDRLIQATLLRARCSAALGRYDAALADLATVQEAAQPEDIHLVRSFVLRKQGKTAESESEFQAAKRLNPLLEPISD